MCSEEAAAGGKGLGDKKLLLGGAGEERAHGTGSVVC